MGLNILFEDNQILIVEKPAGVVVNRSQTIKGPTLQDQMLEYLSSVLPKGSDPNIGGRAGIVHRLDRETSGLLLVAKTQEAFENLQKQFADRKVRKEYIALVHGKVKDQSGSITSSIGRIGKFGKFGVIDDAVGLKLFNTGGLTASNSGKVYGRKARTDFEVISYYEFESSRLRSNSKILLTRSRINYLENHAVDYTLLRLFPKTGRTHQIRVHLKSIGYPIVSDVIYAPKKLVKFDLVWCPRLFLHAKALEFDHPTTGDKLTFKSDLPSDLKSAILNLKKF